MMTTGEKGRTPPDAENYLDLSGVPEESPGPEFDVVLRGYDRRQVDEHVAGLRRMVSQLRAQLAVRERRRPAPGPGASAPGASAPGASAPGASGPGAAAGPAAPGPDASTGLSGPDGSRGRDGADDPTAAGAAPAASAGTGPRTPVSTGADMVGAFNDRLRGILQAAEQEAQAVRSRAAESLLAEHADSRAALADLRAQRDGVFDELMRAKARLDDLVAHAGRPTVPPPGARPWGAPPAWGPHHGPLGGHGPGGSRPVDGRRGGGGPPGGAGPGSGDVDADTASDTGATMIPLQAVDPADRGGAAPG